MSKNGLQRLLKKLEEQGFLDYNHCFEKKTPVKNLTLALNEEYFSIQSVFINDLYNTRTNKEETDIHFSFEKTWIFCELIMEKERRRWIIQATKPDIQKLFPRLVFKYTHNIYYATLDKKSEPLFMIEDKPIDPDTIELKSDRTPDDYFEIKYRVNIYIGGKKQNIIDKSRFIKALPDFIDTDTIKELPYGFSVMLCTQEIPEVIKSLVLNNLAIYQVSWLCEKESRVQ